MHSISIFIIAILATAGVIIRPFKVPEAVWAVTGAVLLLVLGLITPGVALSGVNKGTDVYLFLTGMMLLAESAREEGLFDWLAAHATRVSRGSAGRLFLLVYLVGVVVTVFLSNDATAVVLTPAVAAAVRTAKVKNPLPYLFICAFIANAASFVLPISNPANLVIYGNKMPRLVEWLRMYGLASIVSIVVTFFILRATQRRELRTKVGTDIPACPLSRGGAIALGGIILTGCLLITASALGWQLGLPTAIAGAFTAIVMLIAMRKSPVKVLAGISWAVLPLVAGLFVIVEALNQVGLIEGLSHILSKGAAVSPETTAWISGLATAYGSNLMNNLPAGLIAGSAIAADHLPAIVKSSVLVGIDLGPNLSVTGSLATILWLVALRREGHEVSAWQFLKVGAVVMTIALLAAFLALRV